MKKRLKSTRWQQQTETQVNPASSQQEAESFAIDKISFWPPNFQTWYSGCPSEIKVSRISIITHIPEFQCNFELSELAGDQASEMSGRTGGVLYSIYI